MSPVFTQYIAVEVLDNGHINILDGNYRISYAPGGPRVRRRRNDNPSNDLNFNPAHNSTILSEIDETQS